MWLFQYRFHVVLVSTQRQARKLISGPSATAKTRLLSFNKTQSRAVTGLLTGHNTLRRHLYIMRLIDRPLFRCGAEQESSAHVLCEYEDLASLRHTYLGSLFLDPEDVKVQVWGQSGTLVKEQGFHDMDNKLWGTEGLPKKPRCIGTERAGTHLPFCSILSFSHN
jgi:hypothetical protein